MNPRASPAVTHRSPIPASTNLTDLVPLLAEQEHLAVMPDTSAARKPSSTSAASATIAAWARTPTHASANHLGNGYERLTGEVGMDDETEGKGSAIFKIVADGETSLPCPLMRGGMPATFPFTVSVATV